MVYWFCHNAIINTMKKIIFIFILFLLFAAFLKLISNAKDNNQQWSKINHHIYIDKNSITKNNDTISAWFKIYNSPKNELRKINNTSVYYEINQYEIECRNPTTISITHSKSYDKSNNLLDEYITKQGYACLYPCLVNAHPEG